MKFDRLLVFLLAAAFLVRAIIIFLPVFLPDKNYLISNSIVMDDALITLKIAKNIYSGTGFSFDNVEKTNASSFIWTYMLSPFGFLDKGSFILFSAVLCAVFFVLSGYLLYRICKNVFGGREVAMIIVLLYLFNPFFVLVSINGLETSLFALFLLLSVFWYVTRVRTGKINRFNTVLFSILLALTMLTRNDGIYLFLAFALDYLFVFRGIRLKERLKHFLFMLIIFVIFVSPVFILNYMEFGYFQTSSAYYYYSVFAKDMTRNLFSAVFRKALVFAMTVSIMSLMVGNIVLSFFGFFASKKFRGGISLLCPLIIFSLFELAHYSIIMPILRLRYILAATVILVIGLGLFFSRIKRRSECLFIVSVLAIFIVLCYFTAATWTGYTDIGDSEIRVGILLNRHIINAANFMENEHPDSMIGVSHIGTFAYFSPSTIISDRNGKISYEATDYNMQNKIDEYFEKRGVEYLAGFFSKENLEKVIDSDIVFSEPVTHRWLLKFRHNFGYYAVVKFRKDYVRLMSL